MIAFLACAIVTLVAAQVAASLCCYTTILLDNGKVITQRGKSLNFRSMGSLLYTLRLWAFRLLLDVPRNLGILSMAPDMLDTLAWKDETGQEVRVNIKFMPLFGTRMAK